MFRSYDIVFVGAGPATVSAVLRLIKQKYKGSICILDRGTSLHNRPPEEVISGFGGAGAISDCKLSSALGVGGYIPGLAEDTLKSFSDYILEDFSFFKEKTEFAADSLQWTDSADYNTAPSTLNWGKHRLAHIGSDRGEEIFKAMEDYITSQPNITLMLKSEVLHVAALDSNIGYQICISETQSIIAKNVVIATGQKSVLPESIIEEFNIDSIPRNFQLGIRVEDLINSDYEAIIKANYDFKFNKDYEFDNVKIHVRTFCCNSGNAHTCAELAKEGFISFNGHALKKADPNNTSVNYGIMCEVQGLETLKSKQEQIDFAASVNALPTWKQDNYQDGCVHSSRPLLAGLEHLRGCYPDEILDAMEDFIAELSKVIDLRNATYLYPEIKLSGYMPSVDMNTFKVDGEQVYFIGDCLNTRGIIKSMLEGYLFALNFGER